ncbi:MBL fold metallo-hydrolase [Azospirillum sp. B4]|uniref:MBL fold metallo-hydrolase n=1 Tax=Azospirillum sp. B4 TaxID=95605 RepID=UPI000348DC09|nr:MBL fold metallo-hydrolase [Azospirillum sp. B4]
MPANPYYAGPVTDHFDGLRFFNPGHPATDRSLKEILRWRWGGKRPVWPKAVPGRQVRPEPRVEGLAVTMVGHATVLIQVAGLNLLVDPVWSDRVSPVQWLGPRRVNRPGVAFDHLPPIDAVLLTHNHYDHLDVGTLRRLWATHRPRIVTPLGNDRVIATEVGTMPVETGDWGQSVTLGPTVTAWFHPAYHWSARRLGDRRMALWCGFVLETPAGVVYVAGDTGYGDGAIFRQVRDRYGAPAVAVLPIGAYAPRWFMKQQHCDPAEAVRILADCGAHQGLAVHWGTFPLSDEERLAPPAELAEALAQRGMAAGRFLAMEPGDVWHCEK